MPTASSSSVAITSNKKSVILIPPKGSYVISIADRRKKTIENIDFRKTITSFSGLRATSSTGDFCIFPSKVAKNFINVGGIESPGLASAPAVGEYVVEILKNEGLELIENTSFNSKRVKPKAFIHMNNEERAEIIAKDDKYKKELAEQVVQNIRLRQCGSQFFKTYPILQGELFLAYNVPYSGKYRTKLLPFLFNVHPSKIALSLLNFVTPKFNKLRASSIGKPT